MPVYTIDLALHSACHDYSGLLAALRHAGARPIVGKRWLIEIERDARAAVADLLRLCAPGDALFIVELSRATRTEAGRGVTLSATAAGSRPAPRRSRPAVPSC